MNICADCKRDIIAESRETLGPEIVEYIEMCNGMFQPHSMLIAVLHKIQSINGWLSVNHLDAVAQLMQIPTAKVTGVATFYNFFRLKPRGRFAISVCLGTACFVKGADKLVDRFRHELGIDFGETTSDGMFSLEESRCLGTCGLAPVIMIGDNIHPQVTPESVPSLIEKYMSIARAEKSAATG